MCQHDWIMAKAKTCCRPGCRGIIRDNVCSGCGPVPKRGWQSENRGTRHDRGYDSAWVKLRELFVQEKRLEAIMDGRSPHPICELCDRPIKKVREIHVDHVTPFKGRLDPLRLAKHNLRLVHRLCHMIHTGSKSSATRG